MVLVWLSDVIRDRSFAITNNFISNQGHPFHMRMEVVTPCTDIRDLCFLNGDGNGRNLCNTRALVLKTDKTLKERSMDD
jgi:hypothetical protein